MGLTVLTTTTTLFHCTMSGRTRRSFRRKVPPPTSDDEYEEEDDESPTSDQFDMDILPDEYDAEEDATEDADDDDITIKPAPKGRKAKKARHGRSASQEPPIQVENNRIRLRIALFDTDDIDRRQKRLPNTYDPSLHAVALACLPS